MQPITLVIYEDNAFLRTSLQDSLALLDDMQVVGAFENCNEVVEQIKSLRPNVVLMDIGMPGINGLEGLKLIRKNIPGTLVMMLTVFEDNDNILKQYATVLQDIYLKVRQHRKSLNLSGI